MCNWHGIGDCCNFNSLQTSSGKGFPKRVSAYGIYFNANIAFQKPYEIVLDKFEPFTNTEKDYFDPGTLRISRKGRNNFVFSGDFTIAKNLGDETKVILY